VEDAVVTLISQIITNPTSYGFAFILIALYIWYSKLRNERSIGADFKEVIDELKEQIGELRNQLKDEREARERAENDKYDALKQVNVLTLEIGQLKQQVNLLQVTIEDLKKSEEQLIAQTAHHD
jgi:chromosome segregation ATPase